VGLPEHETAESAPSADRPQLAEEITDRLTLDDALLTLPPEFRAPVVLRDQLGMDYAEIAATLDIPPGTVRSRIARGRARLAEQLSGNQHEPGGRPTTQT
jgi:RNA polymerase sigma-70 factor (ECF subfamily)